MTDQNRKTLRSFYCRDYLWELFEQMAQELGCSMDYLINESMRHYARNRDYSVGEQQGGGQQSPPSGDSGSYGQANGRGQQYGGQAVGPQSGRFEVGGYQDHRTYERMPSVGGPQQGGGQQGGGQQQGGGYGGQQQGGNYNGGGQPRPPSPPGGSSMAGSSAPPPPPRPNSSGDWNQPPSPPQGGGQQQYGSGYQGQGRPPLHMYFNNNRYAVEKDKFVIGRGSQNTDLTIRDGNISRKHCAVIYRNGQYYIKDLGSTNGVEYRGNRIESKKIEEGDVFYLCDYELRFSYRG
jgi:hypothetical protein